MAAADFETEAQAQREKEQRRRTGQSPERATAVRGTETAAEPQQLAQSQQQQHAAMISTEGLSKSEVAHLLRLVREQRLPQHIGRRLRALLTAGEEGPTGEPPLQGATAASLLEGQVRTIPTTRQSLCIIRVPIKYAWTLIVLVCETNSLQIPV